jgi:hypothetical protein
MAAAGLRALRNPEGKGGWVKRKRVGRLCDWNPKQSFATIAITTTA